MMPVHVALLAVPAVAAGFLQAFQFAFLLWPFNLALPLVRHLPRACIALRGVASFCDPELRSYASGAWGRRAAAAASASAAAAAERRAVQQRQMTLGDGDAVADAMIALVDISY